MSSRAHTCPRCNEAWNCYGCESAEIAKLCGSCAIESTRSQALPQMDLTAWALVLICCFVNLVSSATRRARRKKSAVLEPYPRVMITYRSTSSLPRIAPRTRWLRLFWGWLRGVPQRWRARTPVWISTDGGAGWMRPDGRPIPRSFYGPPYGPNHDPFAGSGDSGAGRSPLSGVTVGGRRREKSTITEPGQDP